MTRIIEGGILLTKAEAINVEKYVAELELLLVDSAEEDVKYANKLLKKAAEPLENMRLMGNKTNK